MEQARKYGDISIFEIIVHDSQDFLRLPSEYRDT